MEEHFSGEDFASRSYPCKRIKFFVFSNHKYWDAKYAKPDYDKSVARDPPKVKQEGGCRCHKNEI